MGVTIWRKKVFKKNQKSIIKCSKVLVKQLFKHLKSQVVFKKQLEDNNRKVIRNSSEEEQSSDKSELS